QIEDIDLGYRLRDLGGRILLDPRIQGTHLKRWTLSAMWRTDLFDRGIPWMGLLLERRHRNAAALNTGGAEQIKVVLAASGVALLVAAAVLGSVAMAAAGMLALLALVLSNLAVYRWFRAERGWAFALSVVPLHLAYYVSNAAAAAIGAVRHLLRVPPPVLTHA
ncbi:MAG: glycosyltransferase family 2 protein, partial [Gemmatimonadales bacterium]|nr:glycosyltransferase family 2 protein [Gemmatimonadales bacterium]